MNQVQGVYESQAKAMVAQWRSIIAASVDAAMSPPSLRNGITPQGMHTFGVVIAAHFGSAQQTLAAVSRIKKALDVAAHSHDVETVRSLLNALVPYVMTEDILRQTGMVH